MSTPLPPNTRIVGPPPIVEAEPLDRQRQRQDLAFRPLYAIGLFSILSLEVIASLGALFGIGLGYLHISPTTADVFFVAMFGQIVGLAHIIVRHLFPGSSKT